MLNIFQSSLKMQCNDKSGKTDLLFPITDQIGDLVRAPSSIIIVMTTNGHWPSSWTWPSSSCVWNVWDRGEGIWPFKSDNLDNRRKSHTVLHWSSIAIMYCWNILINVVQQVPLAVAQYNNLQCNSTCGVASQMRVDCIALQYFAMQFRIALNTLNATQYETTCGGFPVGGEP